MTTTPHLSRIEKTVSNDAKLAFTCLSCALVLVIYLNLTTQSSLVLGAVASIGYLLINTIFLENTFFAEETTLTRLALGTLLLIMTLAFFGWLAIVIQNLNSSAVTLVLLSTTILSSVLNKGLRRRNAT